MARIRVAVTATVLVALLGLFPAVAVGQDGGKEGVQLRAQHIILSTNQDQVVVVEIWNLQNSGSSAGDLEVVLPAGAGDFLPEGDLAAANPAMTARGYKAAGLVKPGESTAVFSYKMSVDQAGTSWARAIPYPVQQSFVLVEEGSLDLDPGNLQAMGVMEFDGRRFARSQIPNLLPGAELKFTVKPGSGKAAAPAGGGQAGGEDHEAEGHVIRTSFHGGNANVQLWMRVTGSAGHGGMLGAFFVTVLAVLVIYALVKLAALWRLRREAIERASLDPRQLAREKQLLIRQIADLDRRHARGEMEEESYLRTREQYKRRLVDIMLQMKEM